MKNIVKSWLDHKPGFLKMNSHLKSLLNSLISKCSWFSFKFISVRENLKCLLIQSNHHSFFAVSSLQALRLLCGCCSVATATVYHDGDALLLELFCCIPCRWGPSYLCNHQRRQFAKSAWHHAPRGLESRLQPENQANTTKLPPQQTASEPNEDSDAKFSSSPASLPVMSNIAGDNLA